MRGDHLHDAVFVNLLAPFSPIRAWISPARTVKSTPLSACTPRNDLRIPRICRSGAFTADARHRCLCGARCRDSRSCLEAARPLARV